MPRILRETLVTLRELAIAWGPFIVAGVALLAAAYIVLDPAPPQRVVLATGPESSAYAEFGRRYKPSWRATAEVELRASLGSRENLRLLRDAKQDVQLAFVQGGAGDAARLVDEDRSGVPLASLGSLFTSRRGCSTAASSGSGRSPI